jgi:aminoglycoside phosphotransferase (APT) family kinase protein
MDRISVARLTRLLGFDVYSVAREPVVTGGLHSLVYACQSAKGDLILRICKGQQGFYTYYFPDRVNGRKWMDNHWAIDHARKAGVPAPEIVHSDRAQRWVITKRLLGTQIDSRYERWQGCPYDEAAFGTILRHLHAVMPRGWGPIDDDGEALFRTWPDFLIAAARSAIETCSERGSLPPTVCARLEQDWMPRLRTLDVQTPSLLHLESLGFANLLYDLDTRQITGLLDYEDCIGGDPLFELVWMRYYFEHDGPDQATFHFDRFHAGYGSIPSDDERVSLYEPFPYLDKLRWIAPTGNRARSYVEKLAAMTEP